MAERPFPYWDEAQEVPYYCTHQGEAPFDWDLFLDELVNKQRTKLLPTVAVTMLLYELPDVAHFVAEYIAMLAFAGSPFDGNCQCACKTPQMCRTKIPRVRQAPDPRVGRPPVCIMSCRMAGGCRWFDLGSS